MNRNVYIINGNEEYRRMFEKVGYLSTFDPAYASLICFTGGSDVSPSLYGEHSHPYSFIDHRRDKKEEELFLYAKNHLIPMVGICRGGQFLNVMNGGKMYQHVEGHGKNHYIQDQITKECILVSSTHHQMMRPTKDALVIASTDICIAPKQHMSSLFKSKKIFENKEKEPDIEVLYYKDTNSLCFQPHPEFCSKEYERMTTYFFELINRYLIKE